MRFQFLHHDPGGARITEAAAAGLVGQTPRFNLRESDGGPIVNDLGTARVVAAEVVDGGDAVLITIETETEPEEPTRG